MSSAQPVLPLHVTALTQHAGRVSLLDDLLGLNRKASLQRKLRHLHELGRLAQVAGGQLQAQYVQPQPV